MDAELKRRDHNLEKALRQRYEEWKSIWETREKEPSEELREMEDAFLLDQLRRDSELLKIMKERERIPWRRTCCKRQMPSDTFIKNIRKKYGSS